jgi:hypothetical protein
MNPNEAAYAAALTEQHRLGDIMTEAQRALRAAEERRAQLGYRWRTDCHNVEIDRAYREAQDAVPALEAATVEAEQAYRAAQQRAGELAAACPRGIRPRSHPRRRNTVRGF